MRSSGPRHPRGCRLPGRGTPGSPGASCLSANPRKPGARGACLRGSDSTGRGGALSGPGLGDSSVLLLRPVPASGSRSSRLAGGPRLPPQARTFEGIAASAARPRGLSGGASWPCWLWGNGSEPTFSRRRGLAGAAEQRLPQRGAGGGVRQARCEEAWGK